MNEKILTVLVVASLVLSLFSLILTFRSNGTNPITNIVGQPSGVTWKKVNCYIVYENNGILELIVNDSAYNIYHPLWDVTLTIYNVGTTQTYDLGESFVYSNWGFNCVESPQSLDSNYNRWNITSITAYEIQPP